MERHVVHPRAVIDFQWEAVHVAEAEQGLDLAVGEILVRTLGDREPVLGDLPAHRFELAQGGHFPADSRDRIGLRRAKRDTVMVLVEAQPHLVGAFVAALLGADDAGGEVAPGLDVRGVENEIPKLADAHVYSPILPGGL